MNKECLHVEFFYNIYIISIEYEALLISLQISKRRTCFSRTLFEQGQSLQKKGCPLERRRIGHLYIFSFPVLNRNELEEYLSQNNYQQPRSNVINGNFKLKNKKKLFFLRFKR